MIPIERFPEPDVLAKNKAKWTEKLLEKRKQEPRARPESRQYAHEDVKQALGTMSGWKCFYCEASVKGETPEVDHAVEVERDPSLAFEWENLYLACKECNQAKKGATHIPLRECVDPCAKGVDPSAHLEFRGELIRPKNDSETGRKTIKKYGLSRPTLDYKRGKLLRELMGAVTAIQRAMINEGRKAIREDEKKLLRQFAQAEEPFSLMCKYYVDAALGSAGH